MRTETTRDAEEFWRWAHGWLEREPVLNYVLLTATAQRRSDGSGLPAAFVIARERDGDIRGVVARTPPFRAYVSASLPSIGPLADALLELSPDNDGVIGVTDQAAAFSGAWSRRTGSGVEVAMEQRIFQLAAVAPARPVPGTVRPAGAGDRDLLVSWTEAFEMESDGGTVSPSGIAARNVDLRLAEGRAHVWDHSGPMSYVGSSRNIGGVVRIAPVYTPPGRRGARCTPISPTRRRTTSTGPSATAPSPT